MAALLFLFLLGGCAPSAPPANSIARLAAYQDAALLRAAWALPVARRYGTEGLVSQPNPSACGPTSVADVLRSQGAPATPASVLRDRACAASSASFPAA